MLSVREVEELVKQAIGFQSGRDEIKVSDAVLSDTTLLPEPIEPNWLSRLPTYVHLARNLTLMVAFLLLAATVLILARRAKSSVPATTPVPSRNGKTAEVNGHISHLSPDRFVELANVDPQQVARVLTVLLRGSKV